MVREHLSAVDTTMLRLEDPTNLMMPMVVMTLTEPIDFDRLKATVEARLLAIPRFRQRLVWPLLGLGSPHWENDPDFDLDYHLQRVTLPSPGTQALLQDVASLLASTPLDLTRPPWRFHLIENYDACCALVLRFHHSIADGVALVHVILSLTDCDPGAPWPITPPGESQQRRGHRLAGLLGTAHKATTTMVRGGRHLFAHPTHLLDAGRTGGEAVADLARFLLLRPDPKTVLSGELDVSKRAAWSAGVPLDDIKVIRQTWGGTINDVLLTVVAGALRRYMQDRGEPVDSLSIRVTVPVNVRPPGKEAELGNQVGAVFVTLPVGIVDPACRLGEIVQHMNGRKDSLEASAFNAALNVLGHVPGRITNTLINTFSNRASAVMTNVKGPPQRLYLAGSPVEALLPWAPTTGRMGMALSVLSYAGEVRLGVLTDEGLVPDPEAIVTAFLDEFEVMLAQAREASP